jgi:hypothetical protein
LGGSKATQLDNDYFSNLKSTWGEEWLPITIVEERERINPLTHEEHDEID